MPHQETWIGGMYYPSVTTILSGRPKPWLQKWFDKHPVWAPRKVAAANAIGTEFHAAVESYINGYPWVIRYSRVVRMFDSFKRWADSVDITIQQTELHVVSKEHGYAGTFDAVSNDELFDWKTSTAIYSDMELQLVAYAKAYHEQTGKRIKRGKIVLVEKKRPHRVVVKEYKLGKRSLNAFLKRLEDYRKYSVQRKETNGEVGASV